MFRREKRILMEFAFFFAALGISVVPGIIQQLAIPRLTAEKVSELQEEGAIREAGIYSDYMVVRYLDDGIPSTACVNVGSADAEEWCRNAEVRFSREADSSPLQVLTGALMGLGICLWVWQKDGTGQKTEKKRHARISSVRRKDFSKPSRVRDGALVSDQMLVKAEANKSPKAPGKPAGTASVSSLREGSESLDRQSEQMLCVRQPGRKLLEMAAELAAGQEKSRVVLANVPLAEQADMVEHIKALYQQAGKGGSLKVLRLTPVNTTAVQEVIRQARTSHPAHLYLLQRGCLQPAVAEQADMTVSFEPASREERLHLLKAAATRHGWSASMDELTDACLGCRAENLRNWLEALPSDTDCPTPEALRAGVGGWSVEERHSAACRMAGRAVARLAGGELSGPISLTDVLRAESDQPVKKKALELFASARAEKLLLEKSTPEGMAERVAGTHYMASTPRDQTFREADDLVSDYEKVIKAISASLLKKETISEEEVRRMFIEFSPSRQAVLQAETSKPEAEPTKAKHVQKAPLPVQNNPESAVRKEKTDTADTESDDLFASGNPWVQDGTDRNKKQPKPANAEPAVKSKTEAVVKPARSGGLLNKRSSKEHSKTEKTASHLADAMPQNAMNSLLGSLNSQQTEPGASKKAEEKVLSAESASSASVRSKTAPKAGAAIKPENKSKKEQQGKALDKNPEKTAKQDEKSLSSGASSKNENNRPQALNGTKESSGSDRTPDKKESVLKKASATALKKEQTGQKSSLPDNRDSALKKPAEKAPEGAESELTKPASTGKDKTKKEPAGRSETNTGRRTVNVTGLLDIMEILPVQNVCSPASEIVEQPTSSEQKEPPLLKASRQKSNQKTDRTQKDSSDQARKPDRPQSEKTGQTPSQNKPMKERVQEEPLPKTIEEPEFPELEMPDDLDLSDSFPADMDGEGYPSMDDPTDFFPEEGMEDFN